MKQSKNEIGKRILELVKNLLIWAGALYVWLMYAATNMDHSKQAYENTLNTGPVASGYSIPLLSVILALLMRKQVFSKSKNFMSIATKAIVILILAFGLYTQLSYDPSLSKLREYRASLDARNWDYTGMQLFEAVNNHRRSIGVQEIQLEETFCGNLVERWMAVKNPENGHKGLMDWWADKKLKNDPYGQINELYAHAPTAERVIENWTQSPGHKIPLEDAKYNVGCTYAAEGWGVLIIGEKP